MRPLERLMSVYWGAGAMLSLWDSMGLMHPLERSAQGPTAQGDALDPCFPYGDSRV